MTQLSVNINKIATLRNARGGNIPDIVQSAIDIQRFGANGITVHPRPDERHIRYSDVLELRKIVTTEFNIEGYPNEKFIRLVLDIKPEQVTLVPDPPDAITSNSGWDVVKNKTFLTETIQVFQKSGIRVSIFLNPDEKMVERAAEIGTNRIELYTEPYASEYITNREKAIKPFVLAANKAHSLKLGLNAGHDLNLQNLKYFNEKIPFLLEVSIGHALISDALYFGLENTVQMYQRLLIK